MSNISNSSHANCLTLSWKYPTPTVFEALQSLPFAVLLDSADANHVDARYDIIVAEPLVSIDCDINNITLLSADGTQSVEPHHSETDPLAILQQQLERFFPNPQPVELPFSGGAVMALSYDLGREYEVLPSPTADDLQFPRLIAGIYPWALVRDKQRTSGQQWQLVSVYPNMNVSVLAKRLTELLLAHAEHQFVTPKFKLTSHWQTQLTKAQYLDKFEKIQQYLHSGDCYQINLTQRFNAPYQGDEWQAYLKLRESNAAPFSAFFKWDDFAVLSISPERFLKVSDAGEIETKPIKGTAPRNHDVSQDANNANELQASEKDRAENLMIVDLLRNDIGKVAKAGTVNVPTLFAIESFPAVHHLVSTVTASLAKDKTCTDLLRAAFPGGSITGAPKVRAMQIIDELEPSQRSIYCGSIGYISQDRKMDTSITIRTLLAHQQQLYCWAGGGIVADSDGDAEYQESFDKVSKILPILESGS